MKTATKSEPCQKHQAYYCHECTRPPVAEMRGGSCTCACHAKKPPGGLQGLILRAARTLGAEFGCTALVLACWKLDKAAFGLAGAEQWHPSDNRVLSAVYGDRGLVKRGYMISVGKKQWQLTAAGRAAAK